MSPPWKALVPHKPLPERDGRYVARDDKSGGDYLARLIEASPENIIIVGPAGIGKSTELSHAAAKLGPQALVVQIDKLVNLQAAERDDLLRALITGLSGKDFSTERPSDSIKRLFGGPSGLKDALLGLLRGHNFPLLLLDGLEKAKEEPARALVQLLFEQSELLRTVVVLPPSLVIGPSGYLTTSQSRVFPVRPLAQPGPFFLEILKRRLQTEDWPPEFSRCVAQATQLSGGVPRIFLQLLLNAGTNATLAGRDWPNVEDWRDAVKTQAESLALILRDGDREQLLVTKVHPSGGVDIPLEQRLRLLSHGLLLENESNGLVHVRPLPLLAHVLLA